MFPPKTRADVGMVRVSLKGMASHLAEKTRSKEGGSMQSGD